jgi:hypothetical protein
VTWCPDCGNEYESGVASCADCGVSLVAERPARTDQGPAFVAFLFARTEDRDRVASLLDAAGLPHAPDASPDGRALLAVPLAFAQAAADRIDRAFPDLVVESGEGGILVRPFDPSRDGEIRDHPFLREPWGKIEKGGSESRATLRSCLVRGSRAVRERARALLLRFGPIAAGDLAAALRQAVEQGDEIVAAEILQELASLAKRVPSWPEEVRALASLASSSDPRTRTWGIRIAGRLKLREAGAALIELLAGVDPETAVEADEALTEITGVDLAFEPDLPPERIERIREDRRRALR